MPIRILIVDDCARVRAHLRTLTQSFQEAEVVAEAGEGSEALELIDRHRPQVVLMDIGKPRLNGHVLEARSGEEAIRIAQQSPEAIHILVADIVMTGPELARKKVELA